MPERDKSIPRSFVRGAIAGLFLCVAPACVGGEEGVGKGSATETGGSTGGGSTEGVDSTSSGSTEVGTSTTAYETGGTSGGSTAEMSTVTGDSSSSGGTDTTGEVGECIPVYCGDFEELVCGDPNVNPLLVGEVLDLAIGIPHPRHLDLCDPVAFPEYCSSNNNLEQAIYLRMTEGINLTDKACQNWTKGVLDRANHISPWEWSPVHFTTMKMDDYSVNSGQKEVIIAKYHLGGTHPDKSGQLTMVYSDLEGEFGDDDNGTPPISNIRMKCEVEGQLFFSEPADFDGDSGWINPPKMENPNYPEIKSLSCELVADINPNALPGTVIRVGLADPLPGIFTPMFGPYEPPFITVN